MRDFNSDSKLTNSSTETLTKVDTQDVEDKGSQPVVANMEEIALKALHTDDDSSLNPWTFRTFFLGKLLIEYQTRSALLLLFLCYRVG
jgi:hypothetical protein